MAGQRTRLHFRRRRENKTDYKKRLSLVRAGAPRLVVRQTNSRILMQVVSYSTEGDTTLVSASSDELKGQGWKHAVKNLPAAYLTGMLLAKKAKEKKVTAAIVDLGLRTPLSGSRLFAAVKGAIDGGLKVPADESIFPAADRLEGKHVSEELAKAFAETKAKLAK